MKRSMTNLLAGLVAGVLLGSVVTGFLVGRGGDSRRGVQSGKTSDGRRPHQGGSPAGKASKTLSPREASESFSGLVGRAGSDEDFSEMLSLVSRAAEWSAEDTMEQTLRIEDPYKRRSAMIRLFNYWIGNDQEGALEAIAGLENVALQRDLRRNAMKWLSDDDPVAAIKLLKKRASPQDQDLWARSFAVWAHRDRDEAIKNLLAIEHDGMRQSVLKSVAGRLADTNLEKALEWVGSLEGEVRRTAFEGVLLQAAESDPITVASHLDKLPEGSARNEIIGEAADEWAEHDPAAAVKWAESLDEAERELALGEIAERVLETDPDRARKIAEMVPQSEKRAKIIQSIARLRAAADVEKAVAWIDELPPEDRAGAWGGVAREWAQNDPESAAGFALEVDDPEGRRQLVSSVSYSWSKSQPAEAAEWAQNLDEKTRAGAMSRIVENWAREDPAAAGDYVANSLDGDLQTSITRQLASRWIKADVMEAGNWIGRLPNGEARDGAVFTLVNSIEREYPETALEWANTISDPKKRVSAQRRLRKKLGIDGER